MKLKESSSGNVKVEYQRPEYSVSRIPIEEEWTIFMTLYKALYVLRRYVDFYYLLNNSLAVWAGETGLSTRLGV